MKTSNKDFGNKERKETVRQINIRANDELRSEKYTSGFVEYAKVGAAGLCVLMTLSHMCSIPIA